MKDRENKIKIKAGVVNRSSLNSFKRLHFSYLFNTLCKSELAQTSRLLPLALSPLSPQICEDSSAEAQAMTHRRAFRRSHRLTHLTQPLRRFRQVLRDRSDWFIATRMASSRWIPRLSRCFSFSRSLLVLFLSAAGLDKARALY